MLEVKVVEGARPSLGHGPWTEGLAVEVDGLAGFFFRVVFLGLHAVHKKFSVFGYQVAFGLRRAFPVAG